MAKINLTVTGDSPADCVAAFLASLTDEEVLANLRKRMAEKGNVVTVALDPAWAHAAETEAKTHAWAKAEAAYKKTQAAKAAKTQAAKVKAAKAKRLRAGNGWRKPSGSKVATLAPAHAA